MQYNYDFEITALAVMIVVLLHFLIIHQFPTDKTRAYLKSLLVCVAECVVNILSSIGIANAEIIPTFWNELFAFAFFALEGFCSYYIFCYILMVGEYRKNRFIRVAGLIPFLIFELMVLMTPFFKLFYYFEDGQYHQGIGAWYGYFYIAYYFMLNLILIYAHRKRIIVRIKATIWIYSVVCIVVVLVQLFVRELLLTSFANLTMLLLLYLAMQNTEELFDPFIKDVANEKAFMIRLSNIVDRSEEKKVLTVYIRNYRYFFSIVDSQSSNEILQMVGAYLVKLCGKLKVFYLDDGVFAVLMETEEDRLRVQEQIQKRFSEGWSFNRNKLHLDLALIIQSYPQDFKTVEEFKNMWEYLIEHAKNAKENRVFEANAQTQKKVHYRNRLEAAIDHAIWNNSFEVYYQPIYSVREKRIVSLEALVRLRDENGEFISPEEFIPIAEKNGSILQIGPQVLEESCRFLLRHVLSNPSLGIRRVHINVSVLQCMRQNLKEVILPILEKYHIPPTMISLEITETLAIRAPEQMEHYMWELEKLGISFALDDYGSGNANCLYLSRFPFQKIKIDKEMVWSSFHNPSARIVLNNEINTLKQLGLPVLVEGIETKEQSDEMERLGVDYIQGFYYGKPMPEEECLRYIRQFNSIPEDYAKQGNR